MFLLSLILFILLLWQWGKRLPAPAAYGEKLLPPAKQNKAPTPNAGFVLGLYNIHRARGKNGRKDISKIAQVIQDADIVGLCEVQGAFKRPNQSSILAARLKMAALFCPTQKRWSYYDRGNALLSRFVIQRWSRMPLADSVGQHARSICRCDVDIQGEIIPIFITHLARRVDQEQQLTTVFDLFAQHDKAILMGDFNVKGAEVLLQKLIKQSGASDALTQLDSQADRIDWILLRGLKNIDAGMHDSNASDHPYYWCRIDFKPSGN